MSPSPLWAVYLLTGGVLTVHMFRQDVTMKYCLYANEHLHNSDTIKLSSVMGCEPTTAEKTITSLESEQLKIKFWRTAFTLESINPLSSSETRWAVVSSPESHTNTCFLWLYLVAMMQTFSRFRAEVFRYPSLHVLSLIQRNEWRFILAVQGCEKQKRGFQALTVNSFHRDLFLRLKVNSN